MSPRPETTALIIPALNEAPVIGALLDRVPREMFGTVIVADNGSTDGTSEIAASHGAKTVRISEPGYGAACLAAIAALPREIETLVFIQADLSEDPWEAALLLEPIYAGTADLVIGSRVQLAEKGALLMHQRLGNWLVTRLIRLLYGRRYSDAGAFRAIRRDALLALELRERAFGWTVEMQVRAIQEGLRVVEIPITYRLRAAGDNKVSGSAAASLRAGVRMIWTVLRLYAPRTASRQEIR